jgi:rod shape determining protein RodA
MAVAVRTRRFADERAPIRHIDPVLVAAAFALAVVGLFMVYSATHSSAASLGGSSGVFLKRQLVWLLFSTVALIVTAFFDYRYAKVYAGFLYVGMLLLLILVQSPLGTAVKGAQRGFYVLGFQITPSEWMKVSLVIMLAAFLSERRGAVLRLTDVLAATAIAGVPMFLVFIQPDVGTTIVLAAILAGAVVVAGAKARHLAVLGLGAVLLLVGAFQLDVIKQYQVDRLTAFLDASNDPQAAGYNQRQSQIAIGSGGILGTGYMQGTQTNLDYVPEQHTDFIFTVVGEEFGFVGAVALLFLYGVLLWRAFRIAVMSKDQFGTYLAAGIASMFAIQMFVNVGMTVGIMPITGIPLPFVSYGGSSLLASFAAIGLLLNVHMRRMKRI